MASEVRGGEDTSQLVTVICSEELFSSSCDNICGEYKETWAPRPRPPQASRTKVNQLPLCFATLCSSATSSPSSGIYILVTGIAAH